MMAMVLVMLVMLVMLAVLMPRLIVPFALRLAAVVVAYCRASAAANRAANDRAIAPANRVTYSRPCRAAQGAADNGAC